MSNQEINFAEQPTGYYNQNNLFVMLIAAIIIYLIAAWIVQICWNYTIPNITDWQGISYLQALALLILFNLLFGSFWNTCSNIFVYK